MEEALYRQSRLCRLLGSPVVYAIVAVLHEREAMTPPRIVEAIGASAEAARCLQRRDWPMSFGMRRLAVTTQPQAEAEG